MKIITLTISADNTIAKQCVVVDKIVMFGDNPYPINQYNTLMWVDDVNLGVMETKEEIIELIRHAEVI